MLDELRLLLGHTEPQASRADYATAIVDENVLGKPTRKARELTLRYLSALYSLDTAMRRRRDGYAVAVRAGRARFGQVVPGKTGAAGSSRGRP